MAFPPGPAIFHSMYTLNTGTEMVRDSRAHYAPGAPDPERYPGEMVIRDLRRVRADWEVPIILARYAAIRAWLIGTEPTDAGLADHARLTAHAYLDAVPEWPEGPIIRRLLAPDAPSHSPWELLGEIAIAAEAAGHVDGALAARQAAGAAAGRADRLDVAASVAAEIAALLNRLGEVRKARQWARASRWLARVARTPPTPSSS
jgi:hypothetical protein